MGQQWEYCQLVWADKQGGVLYFTPHGAANIETVILNGNHFREIDVSPTEAIAMLGAHEWELVTAHTYGQGRIFYFKRPIEPGRPIDSAIPQGLGMRM